jgi:hypothetical protein
MATETVIVAIAYTAATLAAITAAHAFFWLIVWANDVIREGIVQHRRLGPMFRILLFAGEDFTKRHEQEIVDYITVLENRERAERVARKRHG